jgi:hypothetical protein
MVHEDDGKDVRRGSLKRKRKLVENKSVNVEEKSEEKLNENYEKDKYTKRDVWTV